jgi:hypothetical protein
MEQLREFLDSVRAQGLSQGYLLGLLHILIGRQLKRDDGTLVSGGITWREAATLLRLARWEPEAVAELGVDPATLPARDRQRYWYSVISQANVGSAEASDAADELVEPLKALGYIVGPPPKT